jgi:hypothetical protein
MNITSILNLLNLVIPAVSNLVLLVKDESGSVTAIVSSTQTANAADIGQIQAWLAAHQAAVPQVVSITPTSATPPAA